MCVSYINKEKKGQKCELKRKKTKEKRKEREERKANISRFGVP